MPTKIEWTDETWNPVTGCTKISKGCKNCYAAKMARRLAGRHGYPKAPHHFDVTLHPSRLSQPTKWKKSKKIFVCSMSDLFHPKIPFDFVDKVMDVVATNPRHTFLVLTKRPKRMFDYFYGENVLDYRGPCMNLWLGVTVENQKAADERIPWLLRTPAAVRFLSCEPLLELIDLQKWLCPYPDCGNVAEDGTCASSLNPTPECHIASCPMTDIQGISWVITGGESGTDARPMHPDWARSLRDQCQASSTAFFFKQWGDIVYISDDPQEKLIVRIGKKRAGHLLDGRAWQEFPNE